MHTCDKHRALARRVSGDGHASSGAFVFGVLVAPSGPSGSADTVEAIASTSEAIARSIFLAGLVVLLGAAAAHIGRFGSGRELGLAAVGWVVSIVGLVLLAVAQRRVAGVGLAELSGTAIGRALLWRTVAIGAAGVALTTRRHLCSPIASACGSHRSTIRASLPHRFRSCRVPTIPISDRAPT